MGVVYMSGILTYPGVVCHDSLLTVMEDVETGKEVTGREALLSYVKMTARSTNSRAQTSKVKQWMLVLYLACKETVKRFILSQASVPS